MFFFCKWQRILFENYPFGKPAMPEKDALFCHLPTVLRQHFFFSFSNTTSHFAHRKTYPEVTNPFLALSALFVCLSIETITRPIWARRDILIRYFDRRRPIAFNGNLCAIMSRQLSDPLWDGNVTIIYKTEPLKRKCKSGKLRAIDGFCVSNETTWKWDFFIRLKEAKS